MTMDDLDHSMHIAQFDWTSFYDDSEECGLLQPSLACPDNSSLSEEEDSENSGPGLRAVQQEIQQSPDVTRAEREAAGEEGLNESEQVASETRVDSERCLEILSTKEVHAKTAEDITEETNNNIALHTETSSFHCSGDWKELKKEDDDLQTEFKNSRHEPDPLFLKQVDQNVNDPHSTAVSDMSSSVTSRAEKERWFVTMNYNPARRRGRSTSVKKKRRQRKACKNNHPCSNRQEKSLENGPEFELNKDKNESAGGTDNKMTHESISDMHVSEKLVISHSPEESDKNNQEVGTSASSSHDTFTPRHPSSVESEESEEFDDGVEFFSVHSYDSESYLSAAESVEESQQLRPVDLMQLQSSVSLTLQIERENDDITQDRQMQSSLSCNVAAANCESYECNDVEDALTFPSDGQRTDKMPDDDSTCDVSTDSTALHTLSDTTGVHNDKINLSACGGSSGDQHGLLPIPDLTVTPCSLADSPESYAVAAGHIKPVYAMSAFWDEMEKLTINDILQLRMGKSSPPTDTQETLTANVNESLTSHSSLGDSGLMELSDTADSDYFTQPDESKPDRSSCEFSTSDFEEEYWQFIGASRNPSPDTQSKTHDRTSESPLLSHEEEESMSSEGKETPVPLEDFVEQLFEDQESSTLSKLSWPRQITKSKSVHNVQALNKEDLTVPFGDDESSLFLSGCQSLEVSGDLGTLLPTPFLDTDHQISFPEMFEYFFTEDEVKNDSWSVTVYNPSGISLSPLFDYTLCSLRDDLSLSSLQCSEDKPIPIFSCCSPTVRELTFPKSDHVVLSADCRAEEEVGNFSPIRVMSHSFIRANHCGTSAKAAARSHSWRSLLSMRKIRFHDKGSMWCGGSGAWMFPLGPEKIEGNDPPVTVLTEGKVSLTPSQRFREQTELQSFLGSLQTTRREGIFSTLKQSDMCLVCIAFASWVLTSSDPEAADAWKAALLANVSALSAIQYLRRYVKKMRPQDNP
ncbi:uro-adherence factor A [Paralichthys olivaceus]|uniref:uro-adherence factor A n=1 Tax=Paralichthys olivaceus TaxID=8255 RepID=UPI00375009C3